MAFRNALKSLFTPPSGASAASDAADACVLLRSDAELDAAIASRENGHQEA